MGACWHVGPCGTGCEGYIPPSQTQPAPVFIPVVLPAGPLPAPQRTPEEYADLLQSHYSLCGKIASLEEELKQKNLQNQELQKKLEDARDHHGKPLNLCRYCMTTVYERQARADDYNENNWWHPSCKIAKERDDANRLINVLKAALYDECRGVACSSSTDQVGYRYCTGCDERAKEAHGPGWGDFTQSWRTQKRIGGS